MNCAHRQSQHTQWLVLERKKNILNENEEIMALALKIAELRYPYNQSKLGNIYQSSRKIRRSAQSHFSKRCSNHSKRNTLNRLMNRSNDFLFFNRTRSIYHVCFWKHWHRFIESETEADIQRIDKSIQSMKFNRILEGYQVKSLTSRSATIIWSHAEPECQVSSCCWGWFRYRSRPGLQNV